MIFNKVFIICQLVTATPFHYSNEQEPEGAEKGINELFTR
jgi:hypothetical protein